MTDKSIEEYCDELELNIIAKRHYGPDDSWSVRITHSWFHNPILTAHGSDFNKCMEKLNERKSHLEKMRIGIERKNEQRQREREQQDNEYNDIDPWRERFWK